jgi:dynactin complex subunit
MNAVIAQYGSRSQLRFRTSVISHSYFTNKESMDIFEIQEIKFKIGKLKA